MSGFGNNMNAEKYWGSIVSTLLFHPRADIQPEIPSPPLTKRLAYALSYI